jgi:hypothetical protein
MEQTPKADPPVAEDEHDRKLLADVEQFGWHMVGIEQDNEGPAFVYSVGQVADLSEGWIAERSTVGAPWARSRNEEGDDGRA